jgi:hypothetical protein
MATTPQGQETRTQILPNAPQEAYKFQQPNYDFAGQLKMPDQVGVRRGDGLGDVVNAAKGMLYYSDMIGFGEASTNFTRGMPFQRLGINYFMPSGLKCGNGADMWTYFEGIPRGDAMGQTIKRALEGMGYPQMRGLAPGIVEDSKAALNPMPILQSAFGNVYPVCEKRTLPVGDELGRIRDPNIDAKDPAGEWVKGDVQVINGRPHQTRWMQKIDAKGNPVFTTQEEFQKTPKTMNPDGTPKAVEGFEDEGKRTSLLLAILFLTAAFGIHCR